MPTTTERTEQNPPCTFSFIHFLTILSHTHPRLFLYPRAAIHERRTEQQDRPVNVSSNPIREKMSSSELEARIAQFEALVDKNDPEQVKMLEDMKRHTALLKKGRGEWDDEAKNRWAVNSTEARSHALTLSLAPRASFVRSLARSFRTYNDPGTGAAQAPKRLPMESASYRAYKNHVIEEGQSLLSIARGEDVPRIEAGARPPLAITGAGGTDDVLNSRPQLLTDQ